MMEPDTKLVRPPVGFRPTLGEERRLRRLIDRGMLRHHAVHAVGWPHLAGAKYARTMGLPDQRQRRHRPSGVTNEEIAARAACDDVTFKEAGEIYGITRERVRQIVKKVLGKTGKELGKHALAGKRKSLGLVAAEAAGRAGRRAVRLHDRQMLTEMATEMRNGGAYLVTIAAALGISVSYANKLLLAAGQRINKYHPRPTCRRKPAAA